MTKIRNYEATCSTCWSCHAGIDGRLECHRRSPQPGWPTVQPTDFCAQHQDFLVPAPKLPKARKP